MAHFVINYSGCLVPHSSVQSTQGLVQVRADFYMDKEDIKYEDYLRIVPVFPPEGYPGNVDENGVPVDEDDYLKWVYELPTEIKVVPFCIYILWFEPTVTEEEILWCFEMALASNKFSVEMGYGVINITQPIIKRPDLLNASLEKIEAIKNCNLATVETSVKYSVKQDG